MQEQAACPVDDLVVRYPTEVWHYQLKDHQTITWGLQGDKLRNDFIAQANHCTTAGETFALRVVVAHDHRKRSLDRNLPDVLQGHTAVVLFPNVRSARGLAGHPDVVGDGLDRVRARRDPSPTGDEALVVALATAWFDQTTAISGPETVQALFDAARTHSTALFRCDWNPRTVPGWLNAERVLSSVAGLEWDTTRGYFEWWYPPFDRGIVDSPCDSDRFRRFASRLLTGLPTSFEDFESLLP